MQCEELSHVDSTRNMAKIHFILLLCLTALLIPGRYVAAGNVEDSWTFSLYVENDMFANTDQDYTNGIKLTWISPDLTGYAQSDTLPDWSLRWIKRLPFINEAGLQRNIALSIGQNMYTPEDTENTNLIVADRPYAGWTYGSIAFHSKNERRLDTIELQAGMVGPLSFAEETQKTWHGLIGVAKPLGWDNQIGNEPGLAVIYERKWRTFRIENKDGLGSDAITHLGATLGNVYTYGNCGVETRFGWHIPADFGTSLIRPAGDTNSPVDQRDTGISKRASPFGCYLFASAAGRAVARNIFLDGSTFSSSHSVDKKHFVADFAAGASIIAGPVKISYAHVFRTKEFEAQRDDHKFASITISFTY